VEPHDAYARPLRNLRLSVTDRCNLRCGYCMPEPEYTWLPRGDLLSYDEVDRLVEVFVSLGVRRFRLTGGEPLVRRDLDALVGLLAGREGVEDLALTTNGVRLADQAAALRQAGLHRLTVSFDTLDPERFRSLTRRDDHAAVLAGIAAARAAGFEQLRLNTVVLAGFNDDELGDLLAHARDVGAEVRFIEYMDVGGATRWEVERVVPHQRILAAIEAAHGPATPLGRERASATATRYRLEDGTTFGVVASTTAPFCGDCDRSRLTADGRWFRCLYAEAGLDLRAPLRAGAGTAALRALITTAWSRRRDRGAEHRLALAGRGPLAAPEELRARPHLEMHTKGG